MSMWQFANYQLLKCKYLTFKWIRKNQWQKSMAKINSKKQWQKSISKSNGKNQWQKSMAKINGKNQ